MLGPEVSAQVHDLPNPQGDQQERSAQAEPLDAAVCALVGVAQGLLAGSQIIHLGDDLGGQLLDAAQLRLDGLELLFGLDGGPVLGVGANVDVELDVADGAFDVAGWGWVSGARNVESQKNVQPVRMFSKHTSKGASARAVKTTRCSPAMSLGLPYSLPVESRIWES
jgi:hypothetical protein